MITAVDLFAGCGGLSSGFTQAGFDIKGAFEIWEPAIKCYKENFDHEVYQCDLSDTKKAVEIINGINPDIVIGSPPCQDFSHAGKRIESDRANLTKSYAKIVATVHPRCFVMENVDRAAKSHAYAVAREVLKNAGYGLTEEILDASLCGAPQKRKRFIVFGALGEQDGFAHEAMMAGLAEKPMTMRDYFGDSLGIDYYYRHPRNYSRRAIYSMDEPSATVRGVNRPVPKGYPGHHLDACEINDSIRPLTTQERAWVQTFPKTYKFVGTKTDVEQMIGNAVPVNLGKYVAHIVKQYMGEER